MTPTTSHTPQSREKFYQPPVCWLSDTRPRLSLTATLSVLQAHNKFAVTFGTDVRLGHLCIVSVSADARAPVRALWHSAQATTTTIEITCSIYLSWSVFVPRSIGILVYSFPFVCLSHTHTRGSTSPESIV